MEDTYKVYLACGNCGRPFIYELKKGETIRYDKSCLRRECMCPYCGVTLLIDGYGDYYHIILNFQAFNRLCEKWRGADEELFDELPSDEE